jgi:hypothetical protein
MQVRAKCLVLRVVCGKTIAAAKRRVQSTVELGRQKMQVLSYTPSAPHAISDQALVPVWQPGGGSPSALRSRFYLPSRSKRRIQFRRWRSRCYATTRMSPAISAFLKAYFRIGPPFSAGSTCISRPRTRFSLPSGWPKPTSCGSAQNRCSATTFTLIACPPTTSRGLPPSK